MQFISYITRVLQTAWLLHSNSVFLYTFNTCLSAEVLDESQPYPYFSMSNVSCLHFLLQNSTPVPCLVTPNR